ncbi:hypothetical protein QDQ39_21250 [Providencia rettgeri]|uniref:major coat protein n=1 Tax=Providencia TaxID=586 RepID=UPI00244B2749|nr:major coat protein [Providencia rettgeri]MDH2398337.1 hypothetical protein [Providencia rettgeri]
MFKKTLATIIVATASIASPAVFAAETTSSTVPKAAQDAITGVGSTATGMIDLAWPVIALVVGGFLAIKMFKKVASKV